MENYKKKLIDQMDDQKVKYFNYLLYGNYGLITTRQFVEILPKMDLSIQGLYLVYLVFVLFQYENSKFTGIVIFSSIFLAMTVCCALITLVFQLQMKSELNKKGSQLYRIYYFSRLLFMGVGSLIIYVSFIFQCFVDNFEDQVNLDKEIKDSIVDSLENLYFDKDLFCWMTLIFGLFASICSTHQIFWQTLLDSSWCNINYIQKEQRAEKILQKALGD